MAITLRLHPCVQVPEVRLQILPVLLLRHPIHAYRSILSTAAIGPLQGWHIDQMRQGVEPSFGFALRSFHYLQ